MTKNRQTKIHQKGMHILERLSEAIKGGIDIPGELDHDMVQLQRGDDSCLD